MRRPTLLTLSMLAGLAALLLGGWPVVAQSTLEPVSAQTIFADDGQLRPIVVKFEGIVEQFTYPLPATWQIDEVDLLVTEKTVIAPPGRIPEIGDYALVSAVREDDTFTARRIVLCPAGDTTARAIEFRGIIHAFPAGPSYLGIWTIGNATVELPPRGMLDGAPAVGYYAQVVGWVKHDRVVEAVSIVVLNPFYEVSRFEFRGAIQSWADSRGGPWTISGVTGIVNAQTTVDGTPSLGAVAVARGRRLPNGTLLYEQVRVLLADDVQVLLRGTIQAIDPVAGVWSVGGINVLLNDVTFVDEVRGRAVPGMRAEVIAQQWGVDLYALRIRVERPE
jgi:hypothetical protein